MPSKETGYIAIKGWLLTESVSGLAGQWAHTAAASCSRRLWHGLLSAHKSSVSGTAVPSAGSVVTTMGTFSDIHPLGILLKDRLPERGLEKAMNLESLSSRSSKSGTENLTIFDAFSKPPNGVATL